LSFPCHGGNCACECEVPGGSRGGGLEDLYVNSGKPLEYPLLSAAREVMTHQRLLSGFSLREFAISFSHWLASGWPLL